MYIYIWLLVLSFLFNFFSLPLLTFFCFISFHFLLVSFSFFLKSFIVVVWFVSVCFLVLKVVCRFACSLVCCWLNFSFSLLFSRLGLCLCVSLCLFVILIIFVWFVGLVCVCVFFVCLCVCLLVFFRIVLHFYSYIYRDCVFVVFFCYRVLHIFSF